MGEERKGFTFIKAAGGKLIGGTLPWMAPEQFDGDTDVQSDIYSFGVVMYQMVNNGNLPFYPKMGHTWEKAHKSYPVPGNDSRLFPLVERCLGKEPKHRPQGFDQLREDLERLYREEITKKTGQKPPPPPNKGELEAGEYVNKGLSLNNLGLHDAAIAEYQKALRINPENAGAHNNLGTALYAKGDLQGAISAYQEAFRNNPENAKAHYNLGSALIDKDDLQGAISAYQEA